MAESTRKMKDEAADLLLKGRYDKALTLFKKVLEQTPEDEASQSKIVYLLRRLNRKEEAIHVLVVQGDRYAQAGFLLKAIATCKVILEINPEHKETLQKLAELHANRAATAVPLIKVMSDPEEERKEEAKDKGLSSDPIELAPEDEGMVLMSAATPAQEIPAPTNHIPGPVAEEEEPIPTAQPEILPENADFDIDVEVTYAPTVEREISEIPLLSDLPQDVFMSLVERMKLLRVRPGEWILKEGESGSSMFIVARGTVRVLKRLDEKRMVQLAILGEGAFFGEMALWRGGSRSASVQATVPVELFEISRELLDEIERQYPSVSHVVKKFAKQRMLRNIMSTSPLFSCFEQKERVAIIEHFLSREVVEGDELITEGMEAEGLFLMLRGKADVFRQLGDGSEVRVGELVEGDVFGEISCLKRAPAMATVRAMTAGTALRLPRTDFSSLILSHPQILEMVNQIGEERFALTQNALAKQGILL
jgi:CRP-like cAMP-binding protein